MGCLPLLALLLGVLLPLAAYTVEVTSHICAEIFFDPLPTPLHHLLWLLVPASNLALLLALQQPKGRRLGLGLLSGLGLGVALFYSLLFLPLLPISVVTIPFGYGLCSLSPLLAVPVGLQLFRKLPAPRPSSRLVGVFLACLALVLAELPAAVSYAGLHLAQGAQPQRGLNLLRRYGDTELLLKACYQKPEWNNSLVGMLATLGSPPDPETVRQIFYRAYGVPFNSYPPPPSATRFLEDEWVWDYDLGGDQVGGRVAALRLQESVLSARVDRTGSTARWFWDLTFTSSGRQREARALVQLPPGGVVSGGTLWVKGEPRPVLIASRAKARQAYEEVVTQSRDPLLITTRGSDQVLVQCFPVPADGTLHIQLEVAAPLLVESTRALLKPPLIRERNFGLPDHHKLELDCPLPLTGLTAGAIPGNGLASPQLGGWVSRPAAPRVWCTDPHGGFTTAQWEPAPTKPSPLWIVIDGSGSLQPYRADLVTALRSYRSSQPVGVVLAGDAVQVLAPQAPATEAHMAAAAAALAAASLVGGQDAVPALQSTRGRVLWIHGAQPALPTPLDTLTGRSHEVVALPAVVGPNRVVEGLECAQAVRTANLGDDVTRLLQGQAWQALTLGRSATRPTGAEGAPGELSLLWAARECAHLAAPAALKLAVLYRIVTPVSGAVVLETREDERRAGLVPASLDDIPVVPEPGPLTLLLALGLGWTLWRRRP